MEFFTKLPQTFTREEGERIRRTADRLIHRIDTETGLAMELAEKNDHIYVLRIITVAQAREIVAAKT